MLRYLQIGISDVVGGGNKMSKLQVGEEMTEGDQI